jgi:hypothetical protein
VLAADPLASTSSTVTSRDSVNAENVQHFHGKGTDLDDLRAGIESYDVGGIRRAEVAGESARHRDPGEKGGLPERDRRGRPCPLDPDLRGARRFHRADRDGKWLQHLGVAAVETLFLSALFLAIDVAEMAWNVEIELRLARHIESPIG